MTRLYLVRHGETEWNKASKVQGSTDIELSTAGIIQAHQLAERLAGEDINVIYSSSLRRALKTAEIVADCRSCSIVKSEKYHEIVQRAFQGLQRGPCQFQAARSRNFFRPYRTHL